MTSVVHLHSNMTGAPVLNGTAGSLINVLDACLVNGFNLRSVDSIAVSGGVATATVSAGHGFGVDTIVLIAGATPSELNGRKRVLATSTTTFAFDATGVADGTATGTISARYAPAGWGKAFSGTNLAAYRSQDITGTRLYLRVNDTGTLDARVIGYESMTDIDTGVNLFPTAAQLSGGFFWPKATDTSATARAWTVIGDSKTFYFWANTHTTSASHGVNGLTYGFGDILSYRPADAFGCFIAGARASVGNSATAQATGIHRSNAIPVATNDCAYLARSYLNVGGSIQAGRRAQFLATPDTSSGASLVAYPNGADNALLLSPILVFDDNTQLRGQFPGVYFVPQNLGTTTFAWLQKIDGQGPLTGRKLLAIKGDAASSTTATNVTLFFDITGPWS